jgi:hypothetical protein
MRSRRAERPRRGREVAPRQALQREGPERGRDGAVARPHGEQIAVARDDRIVVPRVGRRRRRGERRRGPRAERAVTREHGPRGVEHGGRPQVDRQRSEPRQRAPRRECDAAHLRPRGATVGRARDNARVTFTRIAWLVTVLACIVTGIALLISGYQGYAAVFGAVGACAAINLR